MAPSTMIPATLASLLLCASRVTAHGIATALVVYPGGGDTGTFYKGYNPSYQYERPPPSVVQWSTPDDLQNGFVPPTGYSSADIVCHLGATPADLAVPVKGGDVVAIQWTTWPDSHKGPILDMLANCNGPCQGVDKTKLKFFSIGQNALVDSAADIWAGNVMIKNNLTWLIKIPTAIAPGNYVLRHDMVALHAGGQLNGAQNYPFCYNLAIQSSGTDNPAGLPVQGMFKADDPGIKFDLFARKGGAYPMPGPPLYSGALPVVQSKPGKITATGTGVKSLDAALLAPKPTVASTTSSASTSKASTTSAATTATSSIASSTASSTKSSSSSAAHDHSHPTTASSSKSSSTSTAVTKAATGVTTQVITTKVTVQTKVRTTLYTTVRAV